jgi:hypothetical protein
MFYMCYKLSCQNGPAHMGRPNSPIFSRAWALKIEPELTSGLFSPARQSPQKIWAGPNGPRAARKPE